MVNNQSHGLSTCFKDVAKMFLSDWFSDPETEILGSIHHLSMLGLVKPDHIETLVGPVS